MAKRGSSSLELDDKPRRRSASAGGAKGKPRRSLLRRLIRWALLLMLVPVLGVAGLVGIFIYYGNDPNLPGLNGIGDYHPRQVTRILDRDGNLIGELGSEHRTVVPYAKIPKILIQAAQAAEDAEFFEHGGLDYKGMARAFLENTLRGHFAQGASTITQQVVKQMVLTPEKTLKRKVQEIILARRLSQKFSKEEVLELYLNHMYFGHGRYGVEEASRYYFGKPVADINVGEAALLAGMLQSPNRLSPYRHPDAAKKRQIYVLGQMAKLDFIYEDVARKLAEQPIAVVPESAARGKPVPEVVNTVRRELEERHGANQIDSLGTTVKTTIDARLQELARQALERGLEDLDQRQGYRGPVARLSGKALEKRRAELRTQKQDEILDGIVESVDRDPKNPAHGRMTVYTGAMTGVVDLAAETRYGAGKTPLADRFRPGDVVRVRRAPERAREGENDVPLALELGPQAAMVVLDPASRNILALVGGYGYRLGGFDRAQQARRQPGSSFKPFVYAAAIDSKKFTAASLVNDSPEVYKLWKPQNHDRDSFRGPVRLRTALALSINTVAIKLLSDVGIGTVRDLVGNIGITLPSEDKLDLSMALGTCVVSPLEMANAYAAFAASGQFAKPRLIAAEGEQVSPASEPVQGLRADTAYVVLSLMRSVIEEGTARGAAAKLQRPASGKTGTSNREKDAWFVGFTPELLAAVWVGFDDGRSLGHGEAGGRSAAPIWADFMSKALAGQPIRDFVQPPGVVVVQIDPATGLLPAPGAQGRDEVFLDGTAPTEAAAAPGEEASPDQMLLEKPE
jgi:penicillin-binding protein 1A